MSSLIPFENRTPVDGATAQPVGAPAPIVDVSALHRGRTHAQSAARSRRRARRNWDPAFHVDLLTF